MDIDLDTRTDFNPSTLFDNIRVASIYDDKKCELTKHNVGHYFQEIPLDPVTGFSAIPYKMAEDFGYFKMDFLHLNVLDNFESKQEIRELIKMEPNWNLMTDPDIYPKLFQLKKHYATAQKMLPRSIPELADLVAIIRPGKRDIKQAYINGTPDERKLLRQALYEKPTDGGYYFKKSHAHAYAITIVLQLHLIEADIL